MIERLEPRKHRDGTVSVVTTGNSILVKGDASANEIVLKVNTTLDGDDGVPGITTGVGTELIVNGERISNRSYAFSETPQDSVKNVAVDLGDGDDLLRITSENINPTSSVFNGLDIYGGSGDDRVELLCSTVFLRYAGNGGTDSLGLVSGITIYGNAEIRPGDGRDRVTIGSSMENTDVSVRGKLLVVDTNGPLSLTAECLRVRREAVVTTGRSADRISFESCTFFRAAIVSTRGGTDQITVAQSVFRSAKTIDPGQEDDQLTES